MFTKSNSKNSPAQLTLFAVFGLAVLVLCGTANTAKAQTNKGTYLDFTGNGKTDWTVIATPQTSSDAYRWKILGNQTNSAPGADFIRIFDYGLFGDGFTCGDYIGDRKTDVAVYRRGQPGIYYVAQFPSGTGGITLDRAVRWGGEWDRPAHGDFDGDGKLDYSVARYTADGGLTWYILGSETNTMRAINFGFTGGSPTAGADFTGDGRDELVFIADDNGTMTYYIGDAITGKLLSVRQWGFYPYYIDRSFPPADYTGDGKADFVAVRRNISPMVWYILDPVTNTATATRFGYGNVNTGDRADIPIQGDYDGDGKFDIAVYRVSNHTFYVLRSSDGGLTVQTWGVTGDLPLAGGLAFIITN